MSNTIISPQSPAVNPPLNPRSFSPGERVRVNATGYFHGQTGTVRRSFVAGGIRSYYVEGEFGIVAFDWFELEFVPGA